MGEPDQHDVSDPAFAVGLASIFALGCATRFYGLSELPLWMDEATSYFVSTRPLTDILFNKIDNHPPLFFAVQHFWTLIDPNITAIRVPAAAIGSVTVLIVALATSDLVNRRAGLTAGALRRDAPSGSPCEGLGVYRPCSTLKKERRFVTAITQKNGRL